MRISDWSSDVCSSDLNGEAMREPIFYGGEAALSFQYLDFALLKYREDNDWLVAHRGFRIEDAATVARSLNDRVIEGIDALRRLWREGDTARFLPVDPFRSEEHTSELQSLMRISYAVFCLKKKTIYTITSHHNSIQ